MATAMFRPALTPTFWAKCIVEYTAEDGRKVSGAFEINFKRHDREQIEQMQVEIRKQIADGEDLKAGAAFLEREVVGFRGIEIPAEFNGGTEIKPEERDAMLAYLVRAGFEKAMTGSFFAEAPRARAKN